MSRSALLLVAALAAGALAGGYQLTDTWSGSMFFDQFYFNPYKSGDPTHGWVYYTTRDEAQAWGLIGTNGNRAIINADHSSVASGSGRAAVRLESNRVFNYGLFVLDLNHMPAGCGTWPAFWMAGLADWPNSGEIDIIENVNTETTNHVTGHTSAGCDMAGQPRDYSGYWGTGTQGNPSDNCWTNAGDQYANQGCSQILGANTYGAGLNGQGGGIYATLWDTTGIKVWFWNHASAPADLNGVANPAGWGTPAAHFPFGSWCTADHFRNLKIIINLTFCGDWAGGAWSQYCSWTNTDCVSYVRNNPGAFNEAYWDINSIRIYQWNDNVNPNPNPTPTSDIAGALKFANTDLSPGGNDMGSAQKSPVDCYSWCQGTAGCRAFVSDGTNCWLKSTNGPQVGSGGKTAYILQRASSVYSGSDLAPGQCDIAAAGGKSQIECSNWCATVTGCVGFVMTQNICFLKSCTGPIVGNAVATAYVVVNRPPNFGYKGWTVDLGGKDIAPGGCDIGAKTNSGDVDCNYYCQSMPGCRAYVIQGGNCWLKGCVEPVVDSTSDKSAHIVLSVPTSAGNTDIAPGQCDIGTFSADWFPCSQLCHSHNACRAFVSNGSTCWLKSCYGPTVSAGGLTAYLPAFAFNAL